MAGEALGPELIVRWNGVLIGGAREKSVSLNGEAVDITNDDSAGWRTSLNNPAVKSVDITVSGVTKNNILRVDYFGGNQEGALEVEYPNGDILSMTAFMHPYSDTGAYEDAFTYEATFSSSGAAAYEEAASPVNSVLPAISGIAQQGVQLTAFEGVWNTGGTFSYQWKNGGSNIGGATAKTYTPVVGDVGDALSVAVTLTNGAGAASATSGATANVLAA
ncbi:hypothetical protein IZ6_07770 [Terrihabitans soli]|uniref:Phage tail protein n=1 Tax=Terrihabitans soli TaxID=708113 RepID=A0A6S6QRY9_9HYPH|nr:phage tail tube protein [Terrihabitans soli]BCJ90042.1 hypothetical protein IZ6_07770 [Terrihabitans soli]